jgi:hypothetical protein
VEEAVQEEAMVEEVIVLVDGRGNRILHTK